MPASRPHELACDLCGRRESRVVLTGTDRRHGTGGTFELHRCVCGLVRTEPRPTNFASAYPLGEYMNHGQREGLAARVFRRVLDGTATGRWPRPLAGAALAGVPAARLGGPLRPGARVLDVGAGSGHAVAAMIGVGLDAHGLEPSPEAVALAHDAGLTTVAVGSLEDTALEERSWDLIRFWHTLEHVPSPTEAMRVAHDALRPDGRVVVGVPNFSSAGRRLFGAGAAAPPAPLHAGEPGGRPARSRPECRDGPLGCRDGRPRRLDRLLGRGAATASGPSPAAPPCSWPCIP